jgi:hypothetical protein
MSVGGGTLSFDGQLKSLASSPAPSKADFAPAADPCTLIGYKLYIGENSSLVDSSDSNVWKLLPPDVTLTSAPRAPDGSYYRLVAVYRCPDGSIKDSLPSDPTSSGATPSITGIPFRQGKNLIVQGEGFEKGVQIIRDEVPIKTVYESNGRLSGKKAGKSTAPGARIKVRNPDGKESNTVIYQ